MTRPGAPDLAARIVDAVDGRGLATSEPAEQVALVDVAAAIQRAVSELG